MQQGQDDTLSALAHRHSAHPGERSYARTVRTMTPKELCSPSSSNCWTRCRCSASSAAALDAFRKVARDGREVCMSILGVNPIERTELVLSVANEGSFDDACVPRPEGLEFWPDSTRRLEYLGGWHVRCGQKRTAAFGRRPVVLGRKLPCSTTFGHQ